MAELAGVAVQVDDQVVERQHPQGLVYVESRIHRHGGIVQGGRERDELAPAVVALQLVVRKVAVGIVAEIHQRGFVTLFAPGTGGGVPIGIALD